MPITAETLDFLLENRMRDSRDWFRENKKQYEAAVKQPLYELAEAMAPDMLAIDPLIITEPRRILSRINRDLRFSKDKSLYRDHMWITFMRRRSELSSHPAFYFEVSPSGFEYGCGFYSADIKTMDTMREMILEGNYQFREAQSAAESQEVFQLQGEMYKRSRHTDQPEELREWLDRRNIYFHGGSTDMELLCSDRVAAALVEEFRRLAPVYHFFIAVDERRQEKR